MPKQKNDPHMIGIETVPDWYKDAVVYELHVRSFFDSDGDGTGDIRGVIQKLDYLQDLGVTAIWLLPFYPSPLKDDGYDIADYTDINQAYGSLSDFRKLLREAHKRGIRVITELVLNHTSDQHPWFQRARQSPKNSRYRDFYVWSDSPDRYRDARIIFQDFESSNWSWDPVAKAYYWHRFYHHQPDLNFDNPQVHKAVFRVLDFWLKMGVDGLRFDAVPYLYEREGTNCENLPETYDFIRKMRTHLEENFSDRMFLAEANQWPEDAAAYFGGGDQFHMAFHFPLMPRLFMGLRMEDRFPIIDILEQTPPIPESCQWMIFLRNHDELTLEMVTDEERDYMYRTYAHDPKMRINLGIRRRLAPLLGNQRRRIELMNGLLFSLPGTPVIYYGDEIGMGDNIYLGDRNGVRTPMQWSDGRNAGFSHANPQQLFLPVIIDPEYHSDTVNVEVQQNNPHSLLWWMKRIIALRKRFRAFGHGTLEILNSDNPKILAYVRRYRDERILVIANLSRFVQYVELDLQDYKGLMPVELFGRTRFPQVKDTPYPFNLGPHSFYWFSLELTREEITIGPGLKKDVPTVALSESSEFLFSAKSRRTLEEALPRYLLSCRWFDGKTRKIKNAAFSEIVPMPGTRNGMYLTLVRVGYVEGDPDTYLLPLTVTFDDDRDSADEPLVPLARMTVSDRGGGVIHDASRSGEFARRLLEMMKRSKSLRGRNGRVLWKAMNSGNGLQNTFNNRDIDVVRDKQRNTSIVYDERYIFKLYRRCETGINPDLEIGRKLTEIGFPHVPKVAGSLEYSVGRVKPMSLGMLQHYVPNEGDAWTMTVDRLGKYLDRAMVHMADDEPVVPDSTRLAELIGIDIPAKVEEMIGAYLEIARLLGERTGSMHRALASISNDPSFAPEPFSKLFQRSLYQSMRSLTVQTMQMLEKELPSLEGRVGEEAAGLLRRRDEIIGRFGLLLAGTLDTMRIRTHGDYHLGQVLSTGRDFVIIDFEGEQDRSFGERRIKRSPFRDVAGMLRSFDYAAYNALFKHASVREIDMESLEPWVNMWCVYVSSVYLSAYMKTMEGTPFIPPGRNELALLIDTYVLEKAIYELRYELYNRPSWVSIPVRSIRNILEAPHDNEKAG